MTRATTARTAGFTLIELLVVISIVSVLIAMLLPAFGKARGAAQSVLCQTNQRQLAIAAFTYASDHDQHFPGLHYNQSWNYQLIPRFEWFASFLGAQPQVIVSPPQRPQVTYDYLAGRRSQRIKRHPSYGDNNHYEMGILRCPTAQYPSRRVQSGPLTAVNYSFNERLWINFNDTGGYPFNHNGVNVATAHRQKAIPLRVDAMKYPTQTFLGGEGREESGLTEVLPDAAMANHFAHYSTTRDGGFRHSSAMNAFFVDGHVESLLSVTTSRSARIWSGE